MTRILILDCDPEQRTYYGAALRMDGYAVLEAGSAAEALDIILNQAVEVLVMDVCLPDASGWHLLEDILRLRCKLSIIIHTEDAEVYDDFRSWAADVILMKTGNPEHLKATIRTLLPNRTDFTSPTPA